MSAKKPAPNKRQSTLASPVDLLAASYQLVKGNLNIFIFIYSVPALFAILNFLNWFTDHKKTWSDSSFNPSSWVGFTSGVSVDTPAGLNSGLALLFAVVVLIFSLLAVILTFRVAQGRHPDFGEIWEIFARRGFRLFLLEIAMAILIILGFILLIVPGVILIWRLFLAPYILLDQGTGVEESLRRSWQQTRGFGWPIYSLILFGILLGLSGIVPYLGPILSFLLALAYSCAAPLRYFEIKNRPRRAVSKAQSSA